MTSSKAIFLKNPELAKWWISVVHDHRFNQVKMHARGEIMELRPNGDQLIGCELILSTLETLVDSEADPFSFQDAVVGLNHNLTRERQVDQPAPKVED